MDKIANITLKYPELIRSGLEVQEDNEISRSFRWGSNSEAQNRGVKDRDIGRNNSWRKVERTEVRNSKWRMKDHYIYMLVFLDRYF